MNVSERFSAFECKRCNSFSLIASLSTSEQQKQMVQHLDDAHPYWDIEDLGSGGQSYESNFRLVDHHGDRRDDLVRLGIGRKQLLGILGSVLLFVGVFTPIISAPIVGSINYFQNGKGDGVIVLVLALISIILVLAKRYSGLWLTGIGSLALMIFTFVNFQVRMSQMEEEMNTRLAGNPFRGFADVAMQSIQIQWGWAVLVIGAALLIASAAISDERGVVQPTRQ